MAIQIAAALSGFARFGLVLDRLKPAEDSGAMDGIRKAAQLVQKIAAEEMIVRGRGMEAAPLPDRLSGRTGALAGSIAVDDRLPKEIAVGTALVYGAVHELGDRPRPFLAPAVEAASPQVESIIVRSWSEGL